MSHYIINKDTDPPKKTLDSWHNLDSHVVHVGFEMC